jgi:UDP-glucose:(heptosyl)LPS alpha-1,3-glucosyltransferase
MMRSVDSQRFAIRDVRGGLRSPRIAVVIDKFAVARGGAAVYTRDLLLWLAARGFDVHVVTREVGAEERSLPFTFHEARATRARRRFATAALELVADVSADINHDMGAAAGCDIFQPHAGSPVVCQRAMDAATPWWYRHARRLAQDFSRRRSIRRLAVRQFGSARSLFIAVSGRVAADLHRIHGVSPHRIRTIHNGVDAGLFDASRHTMAAAAVRRRHGIAADELLVIAIAHNHRLKGVHVLSDAVRRLRAEGLPLRLLVCGARSPRSRAAEAHRTAIVHAGCVADPAVHYAAADIAVQATFYDACSLATLESLASGLPVITTRANGAAELITPGTDGIVLDDPGDATALANALRTLARDRFLRAAMGRAARRLATRHGSQATFAKVADVYAEVLEAKGLRLVGLAARQRDVLSRAA